MRSSDLARQVRVEAGLSLREMAELSDLAVSTIHRVERGDLRPTVDTLERIAAAAGRRLGLDSPADYSASVLGLGLSIREDLATGDRSAVVRKAAEFVHRFDNADRASQRRMLLAEPPLTGEAEWDAFLAGLAEWIGTRARVDPPAWTEGPGRFLGHGWWVTPMASMRAWEYAGSPVSLQRRGVYLHRDSLTNR
jgi:transcriptional regulator with XRE-family HTH domain